MDKELEKEMREALSKFKFVMGDPNSRRILKELNNLDKCRGKGSQKNPIMRTIIYLCQHSDHTNEKP